MLNTLMKLIVDLIVQAVLFQDQVQFYCLLNFIYFLMSSFSVGRLGTPTIPPVVSANRVEKPHLFVPTNEIAYETLKENIFSLYIKITYHSRTIKSGECFILQKETYSPRSYAKGDVRTESGSHQVKLNCRAFNLASASTSCDNKNDDRLEVVNR